MAQKEITKSPPYAIILKHKTTQNNTKNKQRKHLYIYDKAVTDYAWWEAQKSHDNYMITVLK
jgi:hypothetical protein